MEKASSSLSTCKAGQSLGPATVKAWCKTVHLSFLHCVEVLDLPPDLTRAVLIEKFKLKYPNFKQEHIDGIHIFTRGGIIDIQMANRWLTKDFVDCSPLADAIEEVLRNGSK